MYAVNQTQIRDAAIGIVKVTLLATSLVGAASKAVAGQEAIGMPFAGKNNLSFYTTELSRDGIAQERATIFGGVYGRALGSGAGPVQIAMVVRAGARALENLTDGILDAGATLTATRSIPGLSDLSVTAAAGVGAFVWGQGSNGADDPGTGRLSLRVPLTAGMAYRMNVGSARVAPFFNVTTAYSSDRDYEDDIRIATDNGWRVGTASGVSVRFDQIVLALSDVRRERGLPNRHRVVFSAGVSW